MNRRMLSTLSIIAILGLAAFLRLWQLEATEFKYDEATVCNLAAQFVDTGIPPVRGMGSSVGIDNPPMMIYVMSLPVLLSRDPLIASGFVALLNVIGVWGCYALGKRYWNQGVGLLAALLLAASPWAVFYSRKVWAQDVLLPFVLLFFALVLAWLVDGRRWALAGAIVTLAALTQIHLATLAFAPALALLVLFALVEHTRQAQSIGWAKREGGGRSPWQQIRRWTLWTELLVGVGTSLLLYAPYVVSDALAGWRNARALLAMVQNPARVHWQAVRFALLNVGGREIHALAGAEKFGLYLEGILDLDYWPDRVQEAAAVVGLVYVLVGWWAKRGEKKTFARNGVLLLWLLSPVLFYLRSQTDVFPHYLIPLYPAPYLATAALIVDAGRWLSRWSGQRGRATTRRIAQAAAGTCLALLVAWQAMLSLSIHAFVDQHDTPGGMGTPLRIYREVAQRIAGRTAEWDNPQAVVLCPGDEPRWDECPAVFHFLGSRAFDLRLADYDQALVFPQNSADTLLVLAPGESRAAAELPRFAEELVEDRVLLRESVGTYRFYRLPGGDAPVPPTQPPGTPVELENGVSLLGYELDLSSNQIARLSLYWRVRELPASPPAQGYSMTTVLLGADGERYGQKDGPGRRVGLWHTGDVAISWFDIPRETSQKPATLRLGMYVYTPPDQFTAIQVLAENGRPAASTVDWPLDVK